MQKTEDSSSTESAGQEYPVRYSVFVALNWLVFGYSLAYSSNAQYVYVKANLMSEYNSGLYGAMLAVGGLCGSLLSGAYLRRKFGYIYCTFISSVCYIIGWFTHVFLLLLPSSHLFLAFPILMVARLFVGLGQGISSTSVPALIPQITPPSIRHIVGQVPAFAMNTGFFISYVVGWGLLKLDYKYSHSTITYQNDSFSTMKDFYYSFSYAPLVGMLLTTIGLLLTSLCPSYITKYGASSTEDSVPDPYSQESMTVWDRINVQLSKFSSRPIYRQLIVGMGIMFFQQFLGINAIVFNATSIMSSVNFGNSDPTNGSLVGVFLGCAIFASTFANLLLTKAFKNKTTLYICSTLLIICDIVIGLHFYLKWTNMIPVSVFMTLFVFIFSSSWSPLSWLITNEIYAKEVASIGCSISASCCWIFTSVVTAIYFPLSQSITVAGVFWLFAGVTVVSMFFVFFRVPETKLKTLVEIQEAFDQI